MSSIVALIGRPNVGKSTIFNLLTRSNSSVVADYPGLTRDRKYGKLRDSSIVLIDTGGIGATGNLSQQILEQTEFAIDEADTFLLILDAKEGLQPLDTEISNKLRKANKKIIPVVNKIDSVSDNSEVNEFSILGYDEVLYISAAHNRGIGDLGDILRESDISEDEDIGSKNMTVTIIGRPNVGKSTLLNKLLGKERAVVSSEAGTTRDSIEDEFVYRGKKISIVDTAGMRRKRSIQEFNEKSFVRKSISAIRNSHLAILLIDGSENIVDQDITLISLTLAMGKSVILGINKVDILKAEDKKDLEIQIERKLRFSPYIRRVFISAKEGKGIGKLLKVSLETYKAANQDLDTSEMNSLLRLAIENQPPTMSGRFRPKLKYAHLGGKNPLTIIIHGNNTSLLQASYIKYLENFFRAHLDLSGSPLSIRMKDSDNPFKDKKNLLTERQKKKRRRIIKKRSK
ncbi:MAG: ribosome biogenesis GTPase Der [SAR86 cluster bacterium]|nr:ribosome biogenesis GTPase Der [SAR86 cluster bacterium]